jgi:hypothetical protein
MDGYDWFAVYASIIIVGALIWFIVDNIVIPYFKNRKK